ncbi:AMP-binding protein [Kitasatospora sp. NPDC088391]|uniref:AMP-binding protein n=1 Tax=Kitasatospora sp. NPDC088391 TaxID=3364074 RepID=UPI0037FDF670
MTPPGATLTGRIAEHARRTPDAVALVDTRGPLTYGALARRVAATASGLRAAGLRPGDTVLFAVRPGRDAAVLGLAVMTAGAAVVVADPGAGPELDAARGRLVGDASPRRPGRPPSPGSPRSPPGGRAAPCCAASASTCPRSPTRRCAWSTPARACPACPRTPSLRTRSPRRRSRAATRCRPPTRTGRRWWSSPPAPPPAPAPSCTASARC